MAAQRRIDLVLDSVKRLLRIGATANLLNLLQKQHPADLAQIFSELPDKDREAAFSLLAERNGRLAMEAISELGPEAGAGLLATRPAEEIARLAQEIPSDDAAALIDYLPEDLSAAVLDLMRPKESGVVENLLEYDEQTAGRIMNPHVFALNEDMTVGEAITELQINRDVEMVFYLYVIDVLKDEATEDIYRLAGVAGDERAFTPAGESLRKRLPWLGVNLVTAFLAAAVVGLFEGTISQVTALAVFMPIVAGMGGNAATQTLTVIVRGIALGELTWGNARKALLKEVSVGLGNGLVIGVLAAALVWL